MIAKVRQQEKLDKVKKRDIRRGELPEKFIAKILYRWDDKKFEDKYLRKLEKNWQRWKSGSLEEKTLKGVVLKLKTVDFNYF